MKYGFGKNLVSDQRGNVAMIFGLCVIAIMLVVGLAVDYSNMSRQHSQAQDSIDAAVLAAAKTEGSDAQKLAVYRKALKENFADGDIREASLDIDGQTYYGTAVLEVPLIFGAILGKNSAPVSVDASVSYDSNTLEVALVLDVSGSMQFNDRIGKLQTAAGALLTTMERLPGNDHKVGIVPFTMNVNVGARRQNLVRGENDPIFNGTSWMGCVMAEPGDQAFKNSPHVTPSAYYWPPEPDAIDATYGTAMCKNPSDGTNAGYSVLEELDLLSGYGRYDAQKVGPNRNCVRHEILPMTGRLSTVRTHLNSLTAEYNDGTIVAPGVTWGLRLLSPEAPFSEGDRWEKGTKKFMVVITDGAETTEAPGLNASSCDLATSTGADPYAFDPRALNLDGDLLTDGTGPKDNFSPWGYVADSDPFGTTLGPKSWTNVADDLHNASLKACEAAKKKYHTNGEPIEIFTIGVSAATAPGTKVHDLLYSCASTPAHHFYAEETEDIEAAFEEITERIVKMRLTQ